MLPGGFGWLAVGALAAGVGTLALVRHLLDHRGKPGANWLVAGLTAQAVFCLAHGVSLFVGAPPLRVAGEVVAWLGLVWTGPLFLTFATEYTGRATPSTSRVAAPLAVAMVGVTVAVVTAPFHDLVWQGVELGRTGGLVTLSYALGPLGYGVILFGLGLASVGGLLLVDTVLSYGPLYRREAAAVAASTVPPGAALVAWLAGVAPEPGLTVVAVAFVPHVLCDAYAFVGNEMFETNPTTRRAAERTAVDDIATPVLVLDPRDRVVDYNGAAGRLVADRESADATDADPLGTPVSRVLDVGPEVLADGGTGGPGDAMEVTETSTTIRVGGQHREYVVSRSPLTDPAGTRVGTTLVFQDVTSERRREQRLDVLNRVLRHNLRNAMTVVVGHARMLEADADSDRVAECAETIDRSASDLIDVGEKAREFEALRRKGPRYRTIAVGDAVASAAKPARDAAAPAEDGGTSRDAAAPAEDGGTSVHLTVRTADAEARTDPKLLELVVENLVENAVRHVDDPEVTVAATVADGEVRLAVADDGSGIPENELTPLQSGTESALDHGTGIGLWLVEWSVTALGGTWDVDASDGSRDGDRDGGTTVTVRLPDGEDATVDPDTDAAFDAGVFESVNAAGDRRPAG